MEKSAAAYFPQHINQKTTHADTVVTESTEQSQEREATAGAGQGCDFIHASSGSKETKPTLHPTAARLAQRADPPIPDQKHRPPRRAVISRREWLNSNSLQLALKKKGKDKLVPRGPASLRVFYFQICAQTKWVSAGASAKGAAQR